MNKSTSIIANDCILFGYFKGDVIHIMTCITRINWHRLILDRDNSTTPKNEESAAQLAGIKIKAYPLQQTLVVEGHEGVPRELSPLLRKFNAHTAPEDYLLINKDTGFSNMQMKLLGLQGLTHTLSEDLLDIMEGFVRAHRYK